MACRACLWNSVLSLSFKEWMLLKRAPKFKVSGQKFSLQFSLDFFQCTMLRGILKWLKIVASKIVQTERTKSAKIFREWTENSKGERENSCRYHCKGIIEMMKRKLFVVIQVNRFCKNPTSIPAFSRHASKPDGTHYRHDCRIHISPSTFAT